MNIDEFRERTEKFLTPDEIAYYEVNYEPTYMALEGIDKDTFCGLLKDGNVNRLVCEISAEISKRQHGEEEIAMSARKRIEELEHALHIKDEQLEHAKQALSLISANCDRALSSMAELSRANKVAATR